LLNAKSIGWLPTNAHFADVKEAAKNNWHEGMLIAREWLLIEYAVGTGPVNSETVVGRSILRCRPVGPPANAWSRVRRVLLMGVGVALTESWEARKMAA
jgi:hypothetical protein